LCYGTAGADVMACRAKPDVTADESLSASNIAEKLHNKFVISVTVNIVIIVELNTQQTFISVNCCYESEILSEVNRTFA